MPARSPPRRPVSTSGDHHSASAPAVICVLDSSALVETKAVLKIEQQFPFFKGLSFLLSAGQVAYPPQVAREMTRVQYPDTPGAWIASERGTRRYHEPGDTTVAEVMNAAPDLVDPLDESDPADPYVLAMALEIKRQHPDSMVVVVTNDFVDRRPVKSSLASACEKMGVLSWNLAEFLEWVGPELEWMNAPLDE